MKLTFSSPVATAEVFQICWHIECTTFTASSFRIWNSLTGFPSPPLALLVVMLPKVHLTSHSGMSGFRWVSTPLWLSGSWRSFLYSSSVYSCQLYFISSASVKSISFLYFLVPMFARNISLVSLIFLEKSLVFLLSIVSIYFFTLITEEGFLVSPCNSWNSAFKWVYLSSSPLPFVSLLSLLFVRPPQTIILPFCISFSWGWSWSLPPVQCHEPPSIVLQI